MNFVFAQLLFTQSYAYVILCEMRVSILQPRWVVLLLNVLLPDLVPQLQ